jgi:hypothetical protein
MQAVCRRKKGLNPSPLLKQQFKLTTSSDEGEKQEYLFTSSKPFGSRKTKLSKLSHLKNIQ